MEPIKFIHIADLHLGKRQYNLEQRYKDNFRAFQWVLDRGIEDKVDFILISGDIFDNKNIGPEVLSKLVDIIKSFQKRSQKLLERTIPLICIEGNHDNPIVSSKSWMSFLANLDLLILLSGTYDKHNKQIEFENYYPDNHRGGKIKIKNCIIYGLPFFGSYSHHLFDPIIKAIPKDEKNFTILMMHFGIQGQDTLKQGIELDESLKKLHEKIDYLALGHFHKEYQIPKKDPWIYNPGSLETITLRERINAYEHGAFAIIIDGKNKKILSRRHLRAEDGNSGNLDLIPNRRFQNIMIPAIDGISSFKETINFILDKIKKNGIPLRDPDNKQSLDDLNTPILYLTLRGEIQYSTLEINLNELRREILKIFSILDVRIFSGDLFSTLDNIKIEGKETTIEEIEQEVFLSLIGEDKAFREEKKDVLTLLNDFKSSFIQGNIDYGDLKDQIKEWSLLNIRKFSNLRKKLIPKPTAKVELPKKLEGSKESSPDSDEFEDLDIDLDEFIDDD